MGEGQVGDRGAQLGVPGKGDRWVGCGAGGHMGERGAGGHQQAQAQGPQEGGLKFVTTLHISVKNGKCMAGIDFAVTNQF